MIRKLTLHPILLPALALALLGGCATSAYQYRGGQGDYYYGRPSVEYRYYSPGYASPYGYYGSPYGYYSYPGYSGYYGYPGYSGYFGYYGYGGRYGYPYRPGHHRGDGHDHGGHGGNNGHGNDGSGNSGDGGNGQTDHGPGTVPRPVHPPRPPFQVRPGSRPDSIISPPMQPTTQPHRMTRPAPPRSSPLPAVRQPAPPASRSDSKEPSSSAGSSSTRSGNQDRGRRRNTTP